MSVSSTGIDLPIAATDLVLFFRDLVSDLDSAIFCFLVFCNTGALLISILNEILCHNMCCSLSDNESDVTIVTLQTLNGLHC